MSDELAVYIAFSTEGNIAMASENKELIKDMVNIKNKALGNESVSIRYALISLTYSKLGAIQVVKNLVSKESQ